LNKHFFENDVDEGCAGGVGRAWVDARGKRSFHFPFSLHPVELQFNLKFNVRNPEPRTPFVLTCPNPSAPSSLLR
jgi:hypothetical protein